jgi:N-glycosidase YbiA
MKFEGTDYFEEVLTADKYPGTAKAMGQCRDPPLREDWEDVKEKVMYDALLAKFTQHEELRNTILSTGNRLLVENSTRDRYWGDGGDLSGKNRLGYYLMVVRNHIRVQNNAPVAPHAGTK